MLDAPGVAMTAFLIWQVRKLVAELLFKAEDQLAASAGCEALRMLTARLKRHVDED